MKKMFSILGAFCLGAFITIGVMACCADGTNDAPPFTAGIDCNCIPTIVSYDYTLSCDGSIGAKKHFDFTYDENGRIVSGTLTFGSLNGPFNVEYTKNSVIVVFEDMGYGQKETTTFELKEEDMANPKATNAVIYMLFI